MLPSWARLAETVEDAEAFVEGLLAGRTSTAGSGLIDLAALNPRDKWLNLLLNGETERVPARFALRVGDYFNCRRGIATGANDFFCLTRAEMREHHLTEAHVESCITKATDADGLVFTCEKFDGWSHATEGAFFSIHRATDRTSPDTLRLEGSRAFQSGICQAIGPFGICRKIVPWLTFGRRCSHASQ
jgi:hypothetical protein